MVPDVEKSWISFVNLVEITAEKKHLDYKSNRQTTRQSVRHLIYHIKQRKVILYRDSLLVKF